MSWCGFCRRLPRRQSAPQNLSGSISPTQQGSFELEGFCPRSSEDKVLPRICPDQFHQLNKNRLNLKAFVAASPRRQSAPESHLCRGGFPHSDICGSMLVCQLPAAFRRLPRPSSPVIAKASTTCTYSLDPIALYTTSATGSLMRLPYNSYIQKHVHPNTS